MAPGSDCANACGFDFVAAITSAKPKNIDVHDMKPWDPPLPTEIYAAQYEEISLVLSSPICARVLWGEEGHGLRCAVNACAIGGVSEG